MGVEMVIFTFLHNAIFYSLNFLIVLLGAGPIILLSYIPAWVPGAKALYYCGISSACKLMLACMLVPVEYKGIEHVPSRTQQAIFIANHQSALDLFLLNKVIGGRPQSWLAWNRWWKYPVLGNIAKHSCVPVYFDTAPLFEDKPVGFSAVRLAEEKLHNGLSMVLFPEGERFADGTIHEFKTGFAAMAKLSGKPVVPIFINGVFDVLPPHTRTLRWNKMTVTVGKPFAIAENETVLEFKNRVRSWFLEQNAKKKA